ncbi:MAG: hypothetical protein KJ006_08255 [Thermoleophilia bacterium]|nr:hypothetical protein [Thermoleophilia bacterium]
MSAPPAGSEATGAGPAAAAPGGGPEGAAPGGDLPPVTAIGMTSLALIVAGGIYLASHLPNEVPLAPAVVLLVASAALLAGNLVALARADGFDWGSFLAVGKWALLAYAITAGLIEYAFLRNGLSGGPLVVLTLSIVIYAVHVPMLIAFTVARYA